MAWAKGPSTPEEIYETKPEEFGPKLTHVKGANDIVTDALSGVEIAEKELSAEALTNELANEEEDFPTGCPLSCKETAFRQKKDRALQNKFRTQPELHVKKPCTFSDGTHEVIAKNDKICIPKSLQHKCAERQGFQFLHIMMPPDVGRNLPLSAGPDGNAIDLAIGQRPCLDLDMHCVDSAPSTIQGGTDHNSANTDAALLCSWGDDLSLDADLDGDLSGKTFTLSQDTEGSTSLAGRCQQFFGLPLQSWHWQHVLTCCWVW